MAGERDAKALTDHWRDEHLFVLHQALSMYDDIGRHLAACDTKLQELLTALGASKVDLGKAPRIGSKLHAEFDAVRFWPAGPALISRASTAWDWLR